MQPQNWKQRDDKWYSNEERYGRSGSERRWADADRDEDTGSERWVPGRSGSDRSFERGDVDEGWAHRAGGYGERGPLGNQAMGGYGERGYSERGTHGNPSMGGYGERGYGERGYGERGYGERGYSERGTHGNQAMGGYGERGYSTGTGTSQGMLGAGWSGSQYSPGLGGDRRREFIGKGPKGYIRSDERIREEICERLSEGYIDASEIEVTVHNGEVTLSGLVPDRRTKRCAEELIESLVGIKDIDVKLKVKSGESRQNLGQSQPGSTVSGTPTTSKRTHPSA